MTLRIDLSNYHDRLSLSNKLLRMVWNMVYWVLFRPAAGPLFYKWRILLLRSFGGDIDWSAHVYASAKIWAPWNLVMKRNACLASTVDCYNVDRVIVGESAVISQKVYLCTASHNITDPLHPLITAPITIEDQAWVAADAFVGLGSKHSTLLFTDTQDTVNHVAVEGEKDTTEVYVQTLDEILQSRTSPLLIKIDVEGFETEVLLGGKNTLNNPDLKAVIIELNGSGARYGYKDADIHAMFISAGFRPYTYEPFTRQLTELNTYSDESNTIYIRDVDFVKNRIMESETFKVLGLDI